ncbi:MAG TPA: SCO family protein [Ktedonosporobacter sp.]|nr:SCO family protein [Ktedonosporobacter sp.]
MSMNWRLASRLSVISLAILVVVLVAILQHNNAASPPAQGVAAQTSTTTTVQGADLGGKAAPDFHLTDQFGKAISLSQFKGKPVILTFLYTNCPDACPLTAEKLHTTMLSMGSDTQNVGVLAVSTDPARDTEAAALKFSQAHNMQDYWHYLVGPRETLSPIWTAYNIFAQPDQQKVNHSLGLFLIDKAGNERTFLDNDFTPEQLATNLKVLLKE